MSEVHLRMEKNTVLEIENPIKYFGMRMEKILGIE
jgi:hypothetical protein